MGKIEAFWRLSQLYQPSVSKPTRQHLCWNPLVSRHIQSTWDVPCQPWYYVVLSKPAQRFSWDSSRFNVGISNSDLKDVSHFTAFFSPLTHRLFKILKPLPRPRTFPPLFKFWRQVLLVFGISEVVPKIIGSGWDAIRLVVGNPNLSSPPPPSLSSLKTSLTPPGIHLHHLASSPSFTSSSNFLTSSIQGFPPQNSCCSRKSQISRCVKLPRINGTIWKLSGFCLRAAEGLLQEGVRQVLVGFGGFWLQVPPTRHYRHGLTQQLFQWIPFRGEFLSRGGIFPEGAR